ncbi:hypothetical protein THRCLA_02918 [Thraustotheca clavata]|uniref:Uncharacterized protein n=1 Tax=Thraustotheca clavata TaxID=74557 RepID=A0A1W0A3V3_9STRA|nr:hypothetical protein THRCLA_02918 [Thraustotheca clavata]
MLALLWLWLSLAASVWYLYLFGSSYSNNLLWPEYNTSGYQTFLIDCINGMLELPTSKPISELAMSQNYSSLFITPMLHPAYAMSLITTKLTNLHYSIANLRNTTPSAIINLPTQYCWVDFNQTWELAHTKKRQYRCSEWYRDNGATYLESMLRNTNLSTLFNTTFPEYVWNYALFDEIGRSTIGQQWLKSIYSANTTVSDEVVYWQLQNVTKCQLQWQDYMYPGLDESIKVVNAIGISLSVVLKSTPSRTSNWNTYYFSTFLSNDMWAVGLCSNFSFLPSAPNYYLNKEWVFGVNATSFEKFLFIGDSNGNYINQTELLHETLGPFGSSDFWVVPVPEILTNYLIPLFSILHDAILTNPKLAATFSSIQTFDTNPIPIAWSDNYLYYGGNPLCLDGEAQNYTQISISFDNSCLHQIPLSIALTPTSIVLALFLTHPFINIDSVCSQQQSELCGENLRMAYDLVRLFPNTSTSAPLVKLAMTKLNVTIMQFVTDLTQSNWTILIQPLIDDYSAWTFYGWIMVLDWVQGKREVISLEGDYGTLVLMSEAYSVSSMTLQQGSLTQPFLIVYYVLEYFSAVSLLLGIMCTTFGYHCQLENLFFFHRLVGSTWIGRPLMFLRGGAAIVLLSSAPIHLKYNSAITRFDLSPRTLIETIILSSEATWISVVIHELLLPIMHSSNGRKVAGVSVGLSWLACITIDVVSPISVTSQFDYECRSVDMTSQLYCTSGVITIGSSNRILLLLLLQCIIVPIIGVVGKLCSRGKMQIVDCMTMTGASQAFLLPPMDRVGNILAGILPWSKNHNFDIKLWSFVSLQKINTTYIHINGKRLTQSRWRITKVIAGAVYIFFAISSSISYLQFIQVSLPNDLVWKSFNITGSHVFLSNWFLECFSVCNTASNNLYQPTINYDQTYNLTNPGISFSGHVGAQKQYSELITLDSVITALRKLDACEVPWLYTQYCYMDFQKRWEMANSARRQQRCSNMTWNAAVFLESILRNIDWDSFVDCWGESFNIGFRNELKQSTTGINFLHSLHPNLSVSDEVIYWRQYNIISYTLQWQNYKYTGIVNTYTITNALGVSNFFKVASTHGKYRWSEQTSLKMYWALGNDLKSILDNSTIIGGKSLLRSSPQYAFSNTSLQDEYLRSTSYISSPSDPIYAALEDYIGPFGSIDMIYIGVPNAVRESAEGILQFSQTIRQRDSLRYHNISNEFELLGAPRIWLNINFQTVGGSILCPIQDSGYPRSILQGYESFSFDVICDPTDYYTYSHFMPSRNHIIFAVILANLKASMNISNICEQAFYSNQCQSIINSTLRILSDNSTDELYNSWSAVIYNAVYELNIERMQFGQNNTSYQVTLYHIPLLNPADNQFDFFAWLMLYDWIIGKSEVVSFQGDNGNLTLLGNTLADFTQQVDSSQLPTVCALLAQRCVQYVTFVMIALACITFLYIVFSRGNVEGLNMFELSRVGGMVWIGRPLVLLRSLTALCILSTATVELTTQNGISYFGKTQELWYQTCLAANEVTWLVGIVNDIFIVYTREWTLKYAAVNSILVWIVSACLATITPTVPTITIDPQCQIDTLDYQVTCNLGDVAIGSLSRLLLLCGIVALCNVFCFVGASWFFKAPATAASSSLLLCGGARYLFVLEDWKDDGIYHLDTASAALNGVLSYRYESKWFVFDIKTWRMYVLKVRSDQFLSDAKFRWALPLPD